MADLRQADIPKLTHVRQHFSDEALADTGAAVIEQMRLLFPDAESAKGKEIGITAGSRGITDIDLITKAAVDYLKSLGAKPFIFPAMGSHGGGTAEGQTQVVAYYGISEEAMDCPIRADMETSIHGEFNGITVHCAKVAYESDGILLLNRIKPHTDICQPPDPSICGFDVGGRIESGLTKIGAIGAGKLNGAKEYHNQVLQRGLENAVVVATRELIRAGKVCGGLAIIENAHHKTAKIEAVPAIPDNPAAFMQHEARLFAEACDLMPTLPLPTEGIRNAENAARADALYDVLFVREMGKDISGAGMDTNIIGRSPYELVPGKAWQPGMPTINRIIVSDLTETSHGNAVGMGNADFATERFRKKVNFNATTLNAITALTPTTAKLPVCFANDREAIAAALATCSPRSEGYRFAAIHNTLSLQDVLLSEACLPLLEGIPGIERVGEFFTADFDSEGFLKFPF